MKMTIAELAEHQGVTKPTARDRMKALVEAGQATEVGVRQTGKRGRPPVEYEVADAALASEEHTEAPESADEAGPEPEADAPGGYRTTAQEPQESHGEGVTTTEDLLPRRSRFDLFRR